MKWLVLLAVGCGSNRSPSRAGDCESLRSLALPHVSIESARVVDTFCRVDAIARPTSDSSIELEVAIPVAGWNGRYQQLGNGGFAGLVPEADIAAAAAKGYAAAGTDDGHHSERAINAEWALGHPEKVIDFGDRAVEETHDAALAIITAFTGRAPHHRYFVGCSDGGREGLMEAQRHPTDFDGIVAGAPANYAVELLTRMAWNELAGPIPPAKLPAIEQAALAACGTGGVVMDPLACHFDPAVLRCAGSETDACLTEAQLAALAKIYAGPGTHIGAGLEPGGETAWGPWIVGEDAAQLRFAQTFFRYMVFADPTFDLARLQIDRDYALARQKLAPVINSDNPDLRAFAARGGKLIQWHGWADQVIAPRDSITYFEAVHAAMGNTSTFYRLFMVPGMLHCEGGRGPSELPMTDAIEAWVEHGRAPDQIDAPPDWALCPYPARAVRGHSCR